MGGTSSARPDDLDSFSTGSGRIDDELETRASRLRSLYSNFLAGTSWGHVDAGSMFTGFANFVSANRHDAARVQVIARAFRAAGGHGAITLPDAAIDASLRAAGLDGTRQAVTFDEPSGYGMPQTTGFANDPVNTASGNFVHDDTDIGYAGPLSGLTFTRVHNSRSELAGAFGRGWASWADVELVARKDGAHFQSADGQRVVFPRSGAGYSRVAAVRGVVNVISAGLALDWFGGERWEFDIDGRLIVVSRGPGTEIRFGYEQRRLARITHESGAQLSMTWVEDRITGLVSSDGRRATFSYDDEGNLVEVAGPRGSKTYELDDIGRVASVADADGVVAVINTYDDQGRVVEQLSNFGRRSFMRYLPGRITVTSDDSGGPANTYVHDDQGRLLSLVDGHDQRIFFTYDSWGNPVTSTERNGAVTVKQWDQRSRLVREVLPSRAAVSYSYDDADRVLEVAVDEAVTRYSYDGDERTPSEIVDPEGGVTRLTVSGGLVTQIVDPDGVAVRYEYDAAGALIAAVDGDGGTARIERDAAGRPTAAVTPLGRRTTFRYDERGLLSKRIEPTGATWRYRYSEAGRLLEVADPLRATAVRSYGDHGVLTSEADQLGRATARSYDTFGNITSIVAPDGAKWDFAFDALMRLTSLSDPAGATWLREYDVNGNLVATIDPAGTRRTATVDMVGRVTALDDGLTSSSFEVDAFGKATVHRRPDGTEARAGYDRCGRQIWVKDPDGGTTRVEFTPGGKVRRITSPGGGTEEFDYDRCGRLVARTDGAGRRWEFRHDSDGAVLARLWPGGESETFRYDNAGRLASASIPGQGLTKYSYDELGRVASVTDRVHGRRRFGYDRAGQLVEAIDALGGTTRYEYDDRGWVTRITDPLGGVVRREHDEVGRLVRETDQLGRSTAYAYDQAGQIVERTDALGTRLRWTYDRSGRVSSYGAVGEGEVEIERDALGRPTKLSEAGSFIDVLRWDRAGRLVARRRGELSLGWSYDADGRRAAMVLPDGDRIASAYDAGGLLTSLEHRATGRIEIARDGSGRTVGVTGRGASRGWSYADGELAAYTETRADRTTRTVLERDELGRVVGTTTNDVAQNFGYDEAGQLVSATSGDTSRNWSYDANGRLVAETGPLGTVTYSYDAAGQLASRELGDVATRFEYDAAGRRTAEVSNTRRRSLAWDGLGRLSEVSDVDGDSNRTVRLAVDALGELARVDDVDVLWDTADPFGAACWIGDSSLVGTGTPLATVTSGAADWLGSDWQGTPGEGRDPWGAPAGSGGPAIGFRGELEVAGLSWLRARVYDPATRGFLSPDPLPAVPGTASAGSPYHYAANNPVSLVDPLGLRPVTDAELKAYNDHLGKGLVGNVSAAAYAAGDWWNDNWEYVAAGAMIVGGVALMATGVGGPAGLALMAGSGALISAGASVAIQRHQTGEVDWGEVGKQAAIGAIAGLAGGGAGMAATKMLTASRPLLTGVAAGMTSSSASGMISRGLVGENPFDPKGMATDLLIGGATGGVGGRLGSSHPVDEPDYIDLASPERRGHILYGDATGGGHLWPGQPGKTPFPESWSDDRVMHEISDVATDPNSIRSNGRGGRQIVTGTRYGVDIKVVVSPDDIITGYPTNVPRNP